MHRKNSRRGEGLTIPRRRSAGPSTRADTSAEPVPAALSPKDVRKLGRFTHLGLGAGLEAYVDSGLDSDRDSIALGADRREPGCRARRAPRDRRHARDLAPGRLPEDLPLLHPPGRPQHPRRPARHPAELPRAEHEHRLRVRDERPHPGRIGVRDPARRRRRDPGGGRRGRDHPGRRGRVRPDEGPLDPQRRPGEGVAALRLGPGRVCGRGGRRRVRA